jgi:hypothetical protein
MPPPVLSRTSHAVAIVASALALSTLYTVVSGGVAHKGPMRKKPNKAKEGAPATAASESTESEPGVANEAQQGRE